METKWYVEVIAIVAIAAIQTINVLTIKTDGMVASTTIGAIVFIATRQFYKSNGRFLKKKKT